MLLVPFEFLQVVYVRLSIILHAVISPNYSCSVLGYFLHWSVSICKHIFDNVDLTFAIFNYRSHNLNKSMTSICQMITPLISDQVVVMHWWKSTLSKKKITLPFSCLLFLLTFSPLQRGKKNFSTLVATQKSISLLTVFSPK